MHIITALLLLYQLMAACGAHARSSSPAAADPQFEVASVRPSRIHRPLGPLDLAVFHAIAEHPQEGHLQLDAVPASVLLEVAYNLKDFQIRGLPRWANTEEYEIDARAGSNQPPERVRLMLRSLLVERFGLQFHSDLAEASVLNLAIAKGGLKITAAAPGSCATLDPNSLPSPPTPAGFQATPLPCGGVRFIMRRDHSKEMEASGITMPAFAKILSGELDRLVYDNTGLPGTYNLQLKFTPDGNELTPRESDAALPTAPSIFTALQEQIGLRLQPARRPVEVLVVDHLGRPTPN